MNALHHLRQLVLEQLGKLQSELPDVAGRFGEFHTTPEAVSTLMEACDWLVGKDRPPAEIRTELIFIEFWDTLEFELSG